MTNRTKLLLGGAAAVGLFLFLRNRTSPSGAAFFTELNLVNCKCHSTQFFRDGTTKSTLQPLSRCIADEALSTAANTCLGQTGLDADPDGAVKFDSVFEVPIAVVRDAFGAVASLFSSPDTNARNPGQAV